MMDFNGQIVTATVTDRNDTMLFVQHDGVTMSVALDEFDQVPENGASVSGFAYENQQHQPRLTTKIPQVGLDHFAFATVVQVRKDLGVFVSIGLSDKDIVVSLDQLPELSRLWPARGDRLMVALHIDAKKRLWGTLAPEPVIEAVANRAKSQLMNQDVTATVYRLKMAGTRVLTDEFYLGFIHPSQREVEPRLGEVLKARVIGVRENGELNLSLLPRAYQAISEDAQMLLAMLDHTPDGRLAFTDKSDPEAIKASLGISKGAFKRALGHLLKAKLVQQTPSGIVRLSDHD